MLVAFLALLFACFSFAQNNFAQDHGYNYDERKIAPYTIPDPLILQNGAPVKDSKTWTEWRRPELMAIFIILTALTVSL